MWQDRARELELKAGLIQDMALATETYFSRLQLVQLKGRSAPVTVDDALVEWRTSFAVLDAKLGAYYPHETNVKRQWSEIAAALWTTYFLLRNETPEMRRLTFEQNSEYFGDNPDDYRTLINVPIDNVGGSMAAYDFELQSLLDRFRFKREFLLREVRAKRPSIR